VADPAIAAPLTGTAAPPRLGAVPRAARRPAQDALAAPAWGLPPELAWCLVLAAASIALQGFQFGLNNNLFHIPIVLRWYDLPQFAGDPVIQSLRRYSTPVFPALSLVATEANVRGLFLACHVATRCLTFWALLQMFRSLGLKALEAAAATAAAALAAVVYGFSAIGQDELLISVFTHTALAQAAALLALAWMLRAQPVRAAAAAAVAFDLNFMVGLWVLAPLAAVAAFDLAEAPAGRVRGLALAAAAFALAAAPVAVWMLRLQSFAPLGFDYAAYLADYYGHHFFIGWSTTAERAAFGLQALAGLGAAACLPRRRAAAALAVAALVALFLAGVVVGQVSHSRLLLNLHLLRSDGLTAWLCAALTAAAAVAALGQGRLALAGPALLTLAGLALDRWSIAAGGVWLLLVAHAMLRRRDAAAPAVGRAVLAAGLAGMALAGALGGRYSPGDRPPDPAWTEVTAWARGHSDPGAVFLTPWNRDFLAFAERRDWVSWKEGATAMWAPETYAAWRERSREVRALASAPAALAYACAHRIDYVVLERAGPGRLAGVEAAGPAVFENREFRVAAPACPRADAKGKEPAA
jgi:hypothetical protein